MIVRGPHEPAWVSRLLVPARVERALAVTVAALALGAVLGAGIGLTRELVLDRIPDWLPIVAAVVCVGVVSLYAPWLVRRLRRTERGPWRLTLDAATGLLPRTALAFWVAMGFASYLTWWEWALTALTGWLVVATFLVPYVLGRLEQRTAAERARSHGVDVTA